MIWRLTDRIWNEYCPWVCFTCSHSTPRSHGNSISTIFCIRSYVSFNLAANMLYICVFCFSVCCFLLLLHYYLYNSIFERHKELKKQKLKTSTFNCSNTRNEEKKHRIMRLTLWCRALFSTFLFVFEIDSSYVLPFFFFSTASSSFSIHICCSAACLNYNQLKLVMMFTTISIIRYCDAVVSFHSSVWSMQVIVTTLIGGYYTWD